MGYSGPNPIAIADVAAYLSLVNEDSVTERMRTLRLVQMMDTIYLNHVTEKQKL